MIHVSHTVISNDINVNPSSTNNKLKIDNGINRAVKEAHIWAEGTEEEVQSLGGELSSKGWAQSVDGLVQNFDVSTGTWTVTTDSPIALAIITQQLQNISGYDSTKTQVLKSANGTLMWVEEA